MTSFERPIPWLSPVGKSHKIVKNDERFFDTISSYENWIIIDIDFRQYLKDKFMLIHHEHEDIIN